MYNKMIINLFILSHVLNDFYIQNDVMSRLKRKDSKILLKHSLMFLASAFVLTLPLIGGYMVLCILILSISHFIIDYLKINCEKKFKCELQIVFFIIDQILHIAFIFVLNPLYKRVTLNLAGQKAAVWLHLTYPELEHAQYGNFTSTILFISCMLFLINGGTVAVKLFLNLPEQLKDSQADKKSMQSTHTAKIPANETIQETAAANEDRNKSPYKYGEAIGILERIIIFLFVISSHYESIAFVIAAKSIARFRQFRSNDFSDYYLVGTLSSSLIAIILGELFKLYCKMP